jgi:plastocyanin domain-containing protein
VELVKALLLETLGSESLDIVLDELERGLVSVNGVLKIVFLNLLFLLSKEKSHSLHAHS